MIYLYAQTGKEFGLDSLRRVASVYKAIKDIDEIGVLVSDFRAQQAGIAFGLPPAIPIEDIGLIGGIVKNKDSILLDTNEELKQFIEKFNDKFDKIVRVSRDCNNTPLANEIVLAQYGKDSQFGYWQLNRLEPNTKEPKENILYYGDSDIDLYLHKHRESFKDLDISLVWGEYFYVKYEDDYKESFKHIYESDEFEEILKSGAKVITASVQLASELKVAGYCVVLIKKDDFSSCEQNLISTLNIESINIDEKDKVEAFLKETKKCKPIELKSSIKELFIS